MAELEHTFVYISEVVKFVEASIKSHNQVMVKQGRSIVNGKSLMGLYSLDLLQPVIVEIEDGDEHLFKYFFEGEPNENESISQKDESKTHPQKEEDSVH